MALPPLHEIEPGDIYIKDGLKWRVLGLSSRPTVIMEAIDPEYNKRIGTRLEIVVGYDDFGSCFEKAK